MKLLTQSYGKQRVRFMRVLRSDQEHTVFDVKAAIALEGKFEKAYLTESNEDVVATDTMKNTLTALAYQYNGASLEGYALKVADYFLEKFDHVDSLIVDVEQKLWQRLTADGHPHPHSFTGAGTIPTARLVATRRGRDLFGGLRHWELLKSTGSGFAGFPRDQFTTLPETNDRILATEASVEWKYNDLAADFAGVPEKVMPPMLTVFANNFSPSVQRTLFEMGGAALEAAPELESIRLSMPNKHYLPLNLSALGFPASQNILFLPTDEPHGQIEAVVGR